MDAITEVVRVTVAAFTTVMATTLTSNNNGCKDVGNWVNKLCFDLACLALLHLCLHLSKETSLGLLPTDCLFFFYFRIVGINPIARGLRLSTVPWTQQL